ncbi:NYN domain-containing protein [Nocardiopsis aegyptia]|uniref:Putative RNA-binding protein with PIN domain/chaperonin cofactor prefoldin n=1 Tax=Nocardiopsis aegyptia TaxID=220378 RepID=A0A7Z0JD90_9ACTN|nr:NYN domain-containing protein [Nocardiopsis aegyptia]NYJ37215.1 putative RNA-binding protein with PIN domain/chaperonin cofactor prefoldin [Nocardiopsis aegyptia]
MSARPDEGGEGAEAPDGTSEEQDESAAGAFVDGAGTGSEQLSRPLPEAVRARIVEYGSDVLGGMRAADLPPLLRRVAKFEPRRRARLAGPQIAAQLETDDGFRAMVAARVDQVWPELAEGLRSGVVPPAADPVAVAACAYLLRPEGWPRIIDGVHEELERSASAREADAAAEALDAVRRQLDETKHDHQADLERLRAQIRDQRAEISDLRRKVHTERQRARRAREEAEHALTRTADRESETATQVTALESENRRLRARLTAAESQVENARRAVRTGRNADEARLRVLVDVLVDAAHGLRRELALPTGLDSPADLVAEAEREHRRVSLGGLPDDDPGLLEHMLTAPRVHLLVDGYNVTKTGYGTLPLADQRTRLLGSLEGLGSRTKAEITCVFDGADVDTPPVVAAPRRVRLLFSAPGETADELIVRLVGAEPPGRPVAVVTSDKEIVSAVRRSGARAVSSAIFLRRLESHG